MRFITTLKPPPWATGNRLPVHLVNKEKDKTFVSLIIDTVDVKTGIYNEYLLLKTKLCFLYLDISY